jgi:hypothetical protein
MASKMTKFGYSGKGSKSPTMNSASKHQVGSKGIPETGSPKTRKKGR